MRDADDLRRRVGGGTADDDREVADLSGVHEHGHDGHLTVPMWTWASIVAGLVVLGGGTAAIILVGAGVATWWLVYGDDGPRPDRPPCRSSLDRPDW